MFDLRGEDSARMPENIKSALLSCILSDTQAFRSPATTERDLELGEKIAAELKI